ncbi:hypothetical protein HQO83_06540 [Rhodococcus fascians]|nr:hypothetical protein [Rhodococcus fascians]
MPVAAKPDLPDLSDGMVVGASGYPPVDDGEYLVTAVRPIEFASDEDGCSPNSWMQVGDQEAGSRLVSSSTNAKYSIEIFLYQKRVDVQAWAQECLPRQEGSYTMDVVDLPGLPDGFAAAGLANNDGQRSLMAVGYVRGILVAASVGKGNDGMPNGAKSDLVNMVNKQVEVLQGY